MTLRVPREQCPQHPSQALCGKARLSILPACLEVDTALTTHMLRSLLPPTPQSGPKGSYPALPFPRTRAVLGAAPLCTATQPTRIWGHKDSESSLKGLTIIHPFPALPCTAVVTPARPLSPLWACSFSVTQGQL